jgi:flagellar L-ring protein FlgH
MRAVPFVGATVLACLIVGLASADSIWDRREPHFAFLTEDLRARHVGDILNIAVNENTVANQQDTRALSHVTAADHKFSFTGSSSAGQNVSRAGAAALEIQGTSTRTFNGSAAYTAGRTFVDHVSVSVLDVLPNGNLIVCGYRYRLVGGEQRMLRLTGEVRPVDIDSNNTVDSNFVANFQITYVGRGPETQTTRQGFWARAMNIVWPF